MLRKCLAGLYAAAVITCAGIVPVGADEPDFDQGLNLKQIIESLNQEGSGIPPSASAAGEVTPKEWTVMVFMNAKNNLEQFGIKDLNEMEMIGSSDRVNIVTELGRIPGYDSSNGNWTGSRRFLVQKDNNTGTISSPALQIIPKSDMGDWKHLAEFGIWAKTNFPAKHYMLIVWNHGSGWVKARADFSARGISYDDETGNHITTVGLGQALAQIGKVDVYGSDACLMQMAEVAYEIKDFADTVVGSEETEPGDGYTYNTFLAPLIANPAAGPEKLGAYAVDSYHSHYAEQKTGSTQSAIRNPVLVGLVPMLNDWTTLVMKANETAMVQSALSDVQSFYYDDNKDLYHLVKLITDGTKSEELRKKGFEILTALTGKPEETGKVVIKNGIFGDNYRNAYGLAVYLPTSRYNSSYDNLAWAKATNWPAFAKWVISLK